MDKKYLFWYVTVFMVGIFFFSSLSYAQGPVFTGGAVYGQVKQAESVREAALLNYQIAVQNSFADVENSLIACRKLVDQSKAQAKTCQSRH